MCWRGLFRLASGLFLFPALFVTPVHSSDPVEAFILIADSLANASDQAELRRYIVDNEALVGAAVGQLLDVAIQVGDAGQHQAEDENIAFAKQIAELCQHQTGSDALLTLVATYDGWNESERAIRLEAKELEEQAKNARQSGDYARAIGLLNRARSLLESIGDARSVAIIWGSLGVAYWYTGDFEAVMQQYEQALRTRRAIEDRILEGKTLNGLGSVNYQLGRYHVAFDFYQQAIDLRTRTGDIDGLGTSITYLGNTYLALGRTIDARNAFERALPLIEQSGDSTKQYEILTSIAGLHADCRRMASSNDALRQALKIAQMQQDPLKQMICHNNLALNLVERNKFNAALQELNSVEALLSKTPDREQSVVFHRNRGITLMKMGERARARDDLVTLLELSRESKMKQFELEALLNLGYLLRDLGAYEHGLEYAQQAKALAEQLFNPHMIRESMILLSELERHLGRTERSMAIWEQLLEQDTQAGNANNCIFDQVGIANMLLISGRAEEARRLLYEIRPSMGEVKNVDLELVVALGLGHSFERTSPDSSSYYYNRAFDLIDRAREQIDETEMTGYLSGYRRFYFEEVARFYARQSLAENDVSWSVRAFRTIEKAKARGLLDMMKSSLLAEPSFAEESLLDSLYQLDTVSPGNEERKKDIEQRYATLRRKRLDSTIAMFESEGGIASPEDIQRLLPKDTAFLSYALGDTASLLWIIDRDGFELVELAPRSAINEKVVQLRDAVSRPGTGDKPLRQAAHDLYVLLIAPVEHRIENTHQLIISPDGVLFELPFEVMLSENTSSSVQWGRLPFLARKYSVVYIPSASVYLSLHNTATDRRYNRELLAFGDPDYSLLEHAATSQQPLQQLPYARKEVQAISASLGESNRIVYLGGEANEAILKRSLNKESFRILHLATHGVVDPAEPTASNIVLCPDPEGIEDGHLYTMEIAALDLDIDLAVLSACESARGQIGRGEGVVGLSRALLATGVRGIVASLWVVSDESTALLMDSFYDRMFQSKRPAHQALNEARFALMKDERFSHPYYWSPFIVIGLERTPW